MDIDKLIAAQITAAIIQAKGPPERNSNTGKLDEGSFTIPSNAVRLFHSVLAELGKEHTH